jgi:hypothetical protein
MQVIEEVGNGLMDVVSTVGEVGKGMFDALNITKEVVQDTMWAVAGIGIVLAVTDPAEFTKLVLRFVGWCAYIIEQVLTSTEAVGSGIFGLLGSALSHLF